MVSDEFTVTVSDLSAASLDRGQEIESRIRSWVHPGNGSRTLVAEVQMRYWLMKTEPECFSIEDLEHSPDQTSSWDGVRNYQARNLLRDEIRVGDRVLFYHSSCAEPAIVGLAEVVRGGYPDHTAQDPRSDHYDSKATPTNPIWYMVDVRLLARLPRPVKRDDLRSHPVLAGMMVLQRGSRLSVQPVTADEWWAVLSLAGVNHQLR